MSKRYLLLVLSIALPLFLIGYFSAYHLFDARCWYAFRSINSSNYSYGWANQRLVVIPFSSPGEIVVHSLIGLTIILVGPFLSRGLDSKRNKEYSVEPMVITLFREGLDKVYILGWIVLVITFLRIPCSLWICRECFSR